MAGQYHILPAKNSTVVPAFLPHSDSRLFCPILHGRLNAHGAPSQHPGRRLPRLLMPLVAIEFQALL